MEINTKYDVEQRVFIFTDNGLINVPVNSITIIASFAKSYTITYNFKYDRYRQERKEWEVFGTIKEVINHINELPDEKKL